MARLKPLTTFERKEDITPERLNALVDEMSKIADTAVAAAQAPITVTTNVTSGPAPSTTDHGFLFGLGDDDHVQYAKSDGSRGNFEVAGAVGAHELEADPHPQYLEQSEADLLYETYGAVAAHVLLVDPHTQYLTQTEADLLYETIGAVAAHVLLADPHTQYLTQTEADLLYDPLGSATRHYAVLRDQKSTTTNGGTLTAGWNTRTINTEQVNTTSGDVSLAANIVTCKAGTYYIRASAPASMVGLHQIRLYNVTGAATAIAGTSEWCGSISTRSHIDCVLTFAVDTQLRLEHYVQNTVATTGAGAATSSGEVEVYAELFIEKL